MGNFKEEREKAIEQLKGEDVDSYFLGILENDEENDLQFCYSNEYNTEDTDEISKKDKYLLASILRAYKEKSEEEKENIRKGRKAINKTRRSKKRIRNR